MGKRAAGITRQTVLKPLGLMTTPNPYGVYPAGALSDATNVVMRRPGVVSAAPAGTNYTPITAAGAGEAPMLLAPLDAGHVFTVTFDNAAWRLYEGVPGSTPNTGTTAVAFGGMADLFTSSRIGWTRSRDRALLNSNYGVMVGDYMTPSSAAQRTLRLAGIPQTTLGVSALNYSATGAIPNNMAVSYCVIVTREFSDGYIIKSVPSVPLRLLNVFGTPVTYRLSIVFPLVALTPVGGVLAGDFVEVYRTDGLSTTSLTADPGATFKLVLRHQVTSTESTNGFATLDDNQQLLTPFFTTSGKELYTNPYQEGSTGANRQPDPCKSIATFKSFTFYGNLTERAQWTFSVPGGVNTAAVNAPGTVKRAVGLGIRTVTGTVTNGSPTVTAIGATNLVGIVPGQMHSASSPFPFGTHVVSVGATTITMSANANANAASLDLNDVLTLNGNDYAVLGDASFIVMAGEITADRTVSYDNGGNTSGTEYTVETTTPAGSNPPVKTLTVRGTNGANYTPPIPEYTATVQTFSPTPRTNLLRWSKDSEPEHVPSINETFVGSGQIIAMVATKDALWIACSDGIYRLSGDGGQWRVDTVGPGCLLCAPKCMVNLRDVVFAYTNFGFGAITDSGFVPISDKILRSLLPGSPFAENDAMIMGVNLVEGEVYIRKSIADYLFVYNTTSQSFTRINDTAAHLQWISAIAWQEQPGGSLSQTPLFGLNEPSVVPSLIQWNSTTAKLALQVTYHPFFGEDPFGNKQWIDMCYMFSTAGAGYLLVPAVAFENFASSVPIVALQGGSEAGATCGVPRKFAIAPKLEPGLSVSNGTANAVDFLGVSVRYVPLTLQSGARK